MASDDTNTDTNTDITQLHIEELYNSGEDFEVDWAFVPKLSDIQDELTKFKQATDLHVAQNVVKWREARDGVPKVPFSATKSNVVRKVVKKSNEWKYPSIEEPFLSTNDLFSLDSTVANLGDESVEQMAQILNYQFTKEMDRVAFINRYVRTCGDDGTVIMKLNWEFKTITETKTITAEDFDASRHAVLDTPAPVDGVSDRTILVEEQHTVKNTIDIEFCAVEDFFMDPAAKGDVEAARSIGYRFRTTLSDLKEDQRYKNLGELTLSDLGLDTSELAYDIHTTLSSIPMADIPRMDVVVTEYWGKYDINGDGIAESIVIAYVGEHIIRMEDNPYPLQELPFVVVQSTPNVGSNYGDADAELLGDIQDITSAISRGLIDTIGQTAIGQTIRRKDTFDLPNAALFTAGEHCEINSNGDPSRAAHVVTYPELPQSAQYYLNSLDAEAESLTGVVGFGGSTGTTLGDSATAVRSATDAVSKRELSLLRRLAEGLKKMARKAIRLNLEYLSDDDVLRITGAEQVLFSRSQFQPLVFINIEISTPELNAAKSDKLTFMLQTLGNTIGDVLTQKILAKIAALEGMEDLAKDIRTYEPKPDEHQLAVQKAELEQIKAVTEEKQAIAEYYRSMANMRGSETDLKDQEFVDKASGKKVKDEQNIKVPQPTSRP